MGSKSWPMDTSGNEGGCVWIELSLNIFRFLQVSPFLTPPPFLLLKATLEAF